NPHDESRVPGGTSGGSAAAVSGDMALVALGSDTGGSVRQPASFCGLVGLKPTYGAVSRYGLIAAVSSFDQIGPLTKTVTDAEKLFSLMKGQDVLDATTIPEALYSKKDLKGSKPVIGVPFDFLKEGIDEVVLDNFNQSIEKLKSFGYEIKEITLPHNAYCLPGYYILNFAEISSNLSRLDGIRYGHSAAGADLMEVYMKSRGEGFGREVRRRILLGTYVLSHGYYDAYYNRAHALRSVVINDFKKAYESVDVIVTPTTPTPAWKIGEKSADPISMYLEDVFTVTANFTGMPALSIPSGFSNVDGKSLPLGIQFTASHGQEDILFSVGKDFLGEV
ncbi:MAG: aspartyl/glutamyl-tRNA amidotransferase subunit A, partial [Candidatus Pacebacteria bacterium]|nr:aspartyl/glutamyl-tRNA amidotransferase subunit A [Candidatus Paceibacterota bacterium]